MILIYLRNKLFWSNRCSI